MRRMYGHQVEKSEYSKGSVIGYLDRSPTGNLIIAAGRQDLRQVKGRGWTKTEHIVLLPGEAIRLIEEIKELMSDD